MGPRTWVLALSVAALVGSSVLASDPAFALPRSPCGAAHASSVASGKGYLASSSSFKGGTEYESTVDTDDSAYQRGTTNLPKNLLGQPTGILGGVMRDGLGRVTQYALQAFDIPTYVSKTYEPGTGRLSTYRVDRANTLYRVYGGKAGPLGAYWSRVKPSGPLQARLDSALNPAWGNSATSVATIRVPSGTTIYEGAAASQPIGGGGSLLGGGSQVDIPRVDSSWLMP